MTSSNSTTEHSEVEPEDVAIMSILLLYIVYIFASTIICLIWKGCIGFCSEIKGNSDNISPG